MVAYPPDKILKVPLKTQAFYVHFIKFRLALNRKKQRKNDYNLENQSLTNHGASAKIADMRKVMRKRSTPQTPSERMIHRLKGHLGEQERKVAFELDR